MKRKLLFLASLLSASMVLSACGGLGGGDDNGGEGGDSNNSLTLPGTADEALNKFYQLANEQGFEITYRTTNDQNVSETETVGFKSNVFWVKESAAYKKEGTNLEMYEYDSTKGTYEYKIAVPESEQASLDVYLKRYTQAFYVGYEYVQHPELGSFSSKKDVTILGREATEYTFTYAYESVSGNLKVVFDNATGITLKIYGNASDANSASSGEFEVTSFKVGSAVVAPTLTKSSSQGGNGEGGNGEGGNGEGGNGEGGQGEGGQGEIGDVFSNKLLVYVGNENASLYIGSQLCLFADGKFEFMYTQNGSVIVIFGSYTIATSKTSATLVANKVYKDQDKQLSDMSGTYVLSYVSGAYTLAINNGKVNFNASGAQPTHYVVPGQGGGESDVENFVDHYFTYVSQQNAEAFIGSTIALFDDGTFEVVTTQNGSLLVYLGDYTVNASDTAATLSVTKYYSAASGAYTNQAVGNWLFTLQRDSYALAMAGGPTVYYALSSEAPEHADIPEEGTQTGDDAKYKVTEAQWTAMVYNLNYLTLTSNLSVEATSSSADEGQMKLAFDNGKVRDEGSYYGVTYYSFTSNEEGTYYYQANGSWVSTPSPITFDTFNGYLGLLPVSFDKVSFNSITKCYGVSEWKDEANDMTYWNYRVYFEDGKIMKVTYETPSWTGAGRTSYEFVLYGYGQASVTLPEVGGGQGGDTNAKYKISAEDWKSMIVDGDLVSSKSNFTAFVTSSDNEKGYTMYEFDGGYIRVYTVDPDGATNEYYRESTSATSGYKYYIDPETGKWTRMEDTFGVGAYSTLGVLPIAFSDMTFNENTHKYELRTWTDASGSSFSNISFAFEDGKLLSVSYQGKYAGRAVVFSKYGSTSVTLPEVGSGGQGQGGEGGETSKWPAADIAAKLKQLNLNVTLPEINDNYLVSVTATIPEDNAELDIVITAVSNDMAAAVFGLLASRTEGFSLDYNSYALMMKGIYCLLNEAQDTLIQISYQEDSPVVRVVISHFTGYPYPAEDIAAFFQTNEVETTFPSLAMNNVSYSFYEDGTMFGVSMSPMGENTAEAIISNAEAILLRNGFKIAYVPSYSDEGGVDPMYIDPAMKYYIYFETNDEDETDDSAYMTVMLDDGYMSAAIDFNYPTEKISALTPKDLDDTLPSFEQRGAVYQVNEDTENRFMLWISPQQGMSASSIVANIQRALSAAEYTPIEGGDGGYVSKNGQIEVYVSVIDEKMVQVYVYFPEPEEPPIEEPIEVTYTLVWDKGNWKDDITDADAKIYAYVWGGEEGDQWIELTPQFNEDGTISFELNITSDYTGVKIVRFSPNSKLGWDGDEGVEIWNQSGDYELNGKGGEILFVVK